MRLLSMAVTGALFVMALSGSAQALDFKDAGAAAGGYVGGRYAGPEGAAVGALTGAALGEQVDRGFEKAGDYVEKQSYEKNSGCNNSSLGWRTREALGCD